MNRRRWIATLVGAGLTSSLNLRAQPAKIRRIGWLSPTSAQRFHVQIEAFRQGLREYGYIEERTITVEYRFGGDNAKLVQALAAQAADLVQMQVDLLVPVSTPAVVAVHRATRTIPIVAHDLGTDPVQTGLVASLARPGGNLTGFFQDFPTLAGKLVELARELVPKLSRIGVLWDPDFPPFAVRATESAARSLGATAIVLEAREPGQLDAAFKSAADQRAQALIILAAPIFAAERFHLAKLAAQYHLPVISILGEYAPAGGLMSYGPNLLESFRRLGYFVDKVLKGGKPAEIPIERPERLELAINMTAAKALGMTIPRSILARADQVIE